MPRSHWTALRTVLLVATLLAGLVAVRWLVTGGLNRPMAPPAPPLPAPVRIAHAPPGTRLSLGGRQPIVVDPATGSIARIAPGSGDVTELFRQGGSTVLVADRRVWAVPAGRVGPPRPLGEAAIALPALADDRVWLVDARYGASGRQRYVLVEVGLADGRVHTRWTLPYQTAPIAVLPSGLLARGLQDDLEVVEPGSGRLRGARTATRRVPGSPRGLTAATGWARSPRMAARWPSTPAWPNQAPPAWPSSTWTGAAPRCLLDPRARPRPGAGPASPGPRMVGCTSSRPAPRPRRLAPGGRATGPPACLGWMSIRPWRACRAPWPRTSAAATTRRRCGVGPVPPWPSSSSQVGGNLQFCAKQRRFGKAPSGEVDGGSRMFA